MTSQLARKPTIGQWATGAPVMPTWPSTATLSTSIVTSAGIAWMNRMRRLAVSPP